MTDKKNPFPRGESILTRAGYCVLKALLTGKYLQSSMSMEKRELLKKDLCVSDKTFDSTLKSAEQNEIIVGYVPVLSERGRKLMDALALLYENSEGERGTVSEMLQKL